MQGEGVVVRVTEKRGEKRAKKREMLRISYRLAFTPLPTGKL
jgi:hypothetical protein